VPEVILRQSIFNSYKWQKIGREFIYLQPLYRLRTPRNKIKSLIKIGLTGTKKAGKPALTLTNY
jgi:hypothetical protein